MKIKLHVGSGGHVVASRKNMSHENQQFIVKNENYKFLF
jgi:hypothetical protein